MDDLMILSNSFHNIKSFLYKNYNKKIYKNNQPNIISNIKKKFYSSSLIKKSKYNIKKIIPRTNSLTSSITKKYIGKTLSNFSIRKKSSISPYIFFPKKTLKNGLYTSLSYLNKTNYSLFPKMSNNNNNTISIINNNLNYFNINILNNTNNYSPKITFNENINNFLLDNIKYKNRKNAKSIFLQKIRIMRKAKLIKHYCESKYLEINDIKKEEINNMDNIEFTIKKYNKLFYLYMKTLNYYLRKLTDIKEKENEKLSKLKYQIFNIQYQIKNLKDSILVFKEKLSNLKEIKKFLLEVKFGKKIYDISPEYLEQYGILIEKEKKSYISKRRKSSLEKYEQFRKKNILNSSQRRIIKDKKNSEDNLSCNIKKPKNIPIFDNIDDFIFSINSLNDKLKEDFSYYKIYREKFNTFIFCLTPFYIL